MNLAKKNSKNFFKEKDNGWKKVKAQLSAGDWVANIGFIRPSQMHKSETGETVPMAKLAAIHEYGAVISADKSITGKAITIPERSFMRSTMHEKKSEISKRLQKIIVKVLDPQNPISPQKGLATLAQYISQQMKAKIRSGISPGLSQWTIDRKGSSTPLIDTGQLINSIEFDIKKGKKK